MNQRAAPRSRSLLKGRMIFPNKQSTMDCIVRDISDGGARLHLGHHDLVPDHFDLYVPLKEATFAVAVRWRSHDEVGVMFVTPEQAGESRQDLAARVERLEAEVRELRDLFRSLQEQATKH